MPSPEPTNNAVLKGLKSTFPYKLDLDVLGTVYPYEAVKEAVYSIRDNDPILLRVLTAYLFTNLSRAKLSDQVAMCDPSTYKRNLDKVCALVMMRLNHGDLPTPNLFRVIDPRTGEDYQCPFPKTVFRDD